MRHYVIPNAQSVANFNKLKLNSNTRLCELTNSNSCLIYSISCHIKNNINNYRNVLGNNMAAFRSDGLKD